MRRAALFAFLPALLFQLACSEDPVRNSGDDAPGANGGALAGTGSSGAGSGQGGSGVAGSNAGSGPQAGMTNAGAGGASSLAGMGGASGTATAGAGASTSGGSGLGGASGTSAGDTSLGGSNTGGIAGDAGSGGSAAAAAGASGASGSAGTGGGSGLHGGASAAFICPPGPFGAPLQGMGSVVNIGPPTMGQPNYFAFVEGPVWVGSLGKLFFSDNVSPERIWQVTPGGMPSVLLENSGSNGIALDGDDKLVIADQARKRIARVDPAASAPAATSIADAGCKPNDIIVRSDGNVYYTAPNEAGSGFYRLDPQGARTGPRTEVNAPNGIVLSPDENTLYVGDVGNRSITAFTLAADGSIGATGTPFAMTTNQTLDGMCVDCAGNLYAATQNGVEVFSPAGDPLGTVPTGEASNCTFGGTDRKTIFTTSRALIKSVTLNVPGLPD